MQDGKVDRVALPVKDGWLGCPVCRRKKHLLKVWPETTAKNLPIFCRNCKTVLLLDIERGQRVERRVPHQPTTVSADG